MGLVLVEEVDNDTRKKLLALLGEYSALRSQTLLPPDQQLGAIGSAMVKSAEYICAGIEIGAGKAGDLIEYVTEKSQEKLAKAEEDVKVGSITRGSINAAKSATIATVKASGYVANRVGMLTKSMAGYLATKVEIGEKKQGTMAHVVDAARGGLIAYGTVYNGLETSAKVLGMNMKDNSVKVVSHKYGGDAGDVFGDALTATGNAAMTYMNISSLGVKGLVKTTAKETGKNVIKGESGKSVTKEQELLQQKGEDVEAV